MLNKEMREKLISMSEYARYSGLTVSTISRQIRDGTIPTHQVGRQKLIDPAEADEARRTKLDHSLNKGQVVPISDARARRLAAQAELAELELAREKGRLLDVEVVEKAVSDAVGITKSRLCAIPERMGPVLAAETDMHKVIALLKDEIEGALLSLSEDFLAKAKEGR